VTFAEWAAAYPEAARALTGSLTEMARPLPPEAFGKSEAWSQQRARFQIAEQGGASWRNNVGATPAECPDCGTPRQPVRYGLANDSHALNTVMKSSDLILAIPRIITPQMVGTRIAQFGAVESKPPGWGYTGTGREPPQATWLALIRSLGGYAAFSTGEIQL
jgi:hypothetical protein